MRRASIPTLIAFVIVLASCAPATSQGPSEPPVGGQTASTTPKSLTIALQNEPKSLITIMGGDAGGAPAAQMHMALHQTLAMYVDRGQPYAMLATELPFPVQRHLDAAP